MTIPIQPNDLEHIQANILRPHGRDHVWGLFLQFGNDIGKAQRWVRDFARSAKHGVTSAMKQERDANERQLHRTHDGGIVTNFLFTASGMSHLGFDEVELPTKRDHNGEEQDAFRRGMKSGDTALTLDDKPFGYWEPQYHDRIDALILIADDSDEMLADREASIQRMLDAGDAGKVLFTEKGRMLRSGGMAREHFGFVDGISNTEFMRGDGSLATDQLGIVLHDEGKGRFGSYLVFRKLEQDVPKYYQMVFELRDKLGIPIEQVEAQVIGRFKDGTPLTMSDTAINRPINNFNYDHDQDGARCPFHAHIRKANPRDEEGRKRLLVRRGVPYDQPGKGVGLLFMAYQSDINERYEFIQREWFNNPKHKNAGIDPIVGDERNPDTPGREQKRGRFGQDWNKVWDDPSQGEAYMELRDVVKFKGGEYFYAPSIPALTGMKVMEAAASSTYPPKEAPAYYRRKLYTFGMRGGKFRY